MGTYDGINRFDGSTFKTWQNFHKKNEHYFGNTNIRLSHDNNNQIWVLHEAGISVLEKDRQTFNQIFTFKSIHTNSNYQAIGLDIKNRMWFWIPNEGFLVFDSKTRKLLQTFFIKGNVNCSSLNSKGVFFSGDSVGLAAFFFKDNELHTLHQNIFNSICSIERNDLLLGSGNTLFHFNQHTYSLTAIDNIPDNKSEITTIYGKKLSKIWVGTKSGIYKYEYSKFTTIQISLEYQPLSSFYCLNLLEDNQGNLFIGTLLNGLLIYSPLVNRFENIIANKNEKKPVLSLASSGDFIYTGNLDGLTVYQNGIVKSQISFNSFSAFPNEIYSLQLFNNRLLISSGNAKHFFAWYDLNTNQLTELDFYKPYLNNSSYNRPASLQTKDFIFLNYFNEIFAFNKLTNEFEHLCTLPNLVLSFGDINNQLLAIGTTNGLHTFNLTTRKLSNSINKEYAINDICFVRNEYWIATNNGLLVFNNNLKQIAQYNTTNSLINNKIYAIRYDSKSKIWFSHNKGISFYSLIDKRFGHFGILDGLQGNEFNQLAACTLYNGDLVFGGVNGLSIIKYYLFNTYRFPNKPTITNITVNDQMYQFKDNISTLIDIELKPNENTFSIEFQYINFENSENVKYKYKLNGIDKDWIETSNKKFARYVSIPHGTYVFEVMVQNNEGLWCKESRKLSITILAPFYKKIWFITLCCILGLFASFGIIKWILFLQDRNFQQQLKIKNTLQNERERISKELHDSVGNNLSYVQFSLQTITHNDENKTQLNEIRGTINDVILNLRDTIWTINHEKVLFSEMMERFKDYAIKLQNVQPQIEVEINEKFEKDVELSPAISLSMYRLMQEALTNVYKHSEAKNCAILVCVYYNHNIEISIEDNGKGFDTNKRYSDSYGLKNMKLRAEELHAHLDIKSDSAFGSKIVLTLQV